jgi:[ribosomal protein S5]-alanine N-acetyltransferase
MRFLSDTTMDRWQTWRAIAGAIGHWALRGYGQWVIALRGSGEAIGRTGLYHPEGWPALEVGYVIAPEHQGRGYATEAAGASLRYAFDTVRATRVCSLVRPANTASRRVAEKLGGVVEQTVDLLGGDALMYVYPPPQ